MSTSDLVETTVLVSGLNCNGCVGTLTRKALTIYGVVHVDVVLVSGGESTVTLRHSRDLASDRVVDALGEFGYRVHLPAAA